METATMTWIRNLKRPAVGIAAVAALLTAACDDERAPFDSGTPIPEAAVTIGLEVSSLRAGVNRQIAVAVRADAEQAPAALQGHVYFDASRLRYAGQVPEAFLAIVNERDADRGHIRLASLEVKGLPARTAVLAFEVLAPDYDRGLRYASDEAVTQAVELARAIVRREITESADLDPTGARHLSLADWRSRLYPDEPDGPIVQRSPGEYRLNLVFGDANLSGGLTTFDAAVTANAAVGNNEIIIGTDAPDRDFAVAANVRPSNGTGLGEVTDPVPPGLDASGTRTISTLDAAAIGNEAVGTDQSIVGELIPGRGPLPVNVVSVPAGDITVNTLWTKNNIYQLEGLVSVTNGATLTIEEGTTVRGNTAANPTALIITRNGFLVAIGTPLEPIRFTCTGPAAPGCWSGLVIIGNDSVPEATAGLPASPAIAGRSAGGCLQRQTEGLPVGDDRYFWGGCNPQDSSGVLRYAVIEYGGFVVASNNELNGLTLPSVGSGTDIDHIQVHAGLDDAVELFGGSVDLKHLYLTANSDDNFDCSFGYRGRVQFVIIQHDSAASDNDKGIECDNTETAATYNNEPRVRGRVWNLTFVGRFDPNATDGVANNNSLDAFHLRRGTRPQFHNTLVVNARRLLDIDDAPTCEAELNGTGPGGQGLAIQTSLFFTGGGGAGNTDADPTCPPYPASLTALEDSILLDPVNGNTVQTSSAGQLKAPWSPMFPDFRPVAGSTAATFVGATPPNDGFFDITATYAGAVAPANATGSNIPWYSGWTRGWTSNTVK
jgi:hypothetical protein